MRVRMLRSVKGEVLSGSRRRAVKEEWDVRRREREVEGVKERGEVEDRTGGTAEDDEKE